MSWQTEKVVVVTGGAGFIGSNLADTLLTRGERVVVYDDLSRPGAERNLRWLVSRHPKRLQVEVGDVRDADRVKRVIARAHTVYHLAAQVAVTTSVADPAHDFSVNVGGTLNVLEAAREQGEPPVVLYTSTNKVYGELGGVGVSLNGTRYRFTDERRGIGEDQPLDFHSPYGCSKGAADQYVRDYARIFGMPTCVFRMSCIYGPRQYGTEDQGWVAHFVIAALAGRTLTLYGDGKQVRDLLFVEDLVEAMQRATSAARGHPGRIYNVGGGPRNATSLLELIGLLETVLGQPVPVRFAEWRPGDQRLYVTDLTRITRELDWTPRVTKEEGVRRLVEWVRASPSLLLAAPVGGAAEPLTA
ncbi:MAG: SDR family NAD(P)-dependent oxidoreductase [Gemmatimonadetes bacterium]|nr:SDR family NAD(P)-dependent oxidoreductase [Gemmatimonadota bacterium]